jgi:putative transcriptional regulator
MGWSSLGGRLLVATPMLGDPNFDRTVVLLIEHSTEGALGVVLNRPGSMDVVDAVPEWGDLAAEPAVLFSGGPVQGNFLVGLGEVAGGPTVAAPTDDSWRPLVGAVGTVNLGQAPDAGGARLRRVRLFAGYAGWGGGQLEGEIEAKAWFVVDAMPDDALTAEPDELWSAVLRRQRGQLRLLARYPENPATN